MAQKKEISPRVLKLLSEAGSTDEKVAMGAQYQLAQAFAPVLKKGVLKGNILGGIYSEVTFAPGVRPEWPLDLLAPGTEKDHVAYAIPNHGRIPENAVEGDFVMIPTYGISFSIDYLLKYARDARWDIETRAMEVYEAGFVRKKNDDGWKVIVAAGKNRGIMVYDDVATNGFFTKRLVALAKTIMRRNAGGNSTSLNKGMLTDLYVSPEATADVYSWDLTQIDDNSRQSIFLSSGGETGDEYVMNIAGVRVHALDELGVGQLYQLYYTSTLGGSLATGKLELGVGLDLSKDDCFINAIAQPRITRPDEALWRQMRKGVFGWEEGGFGALDSRRVELVSI